MKLFCRILIPLISLVALVLLGGTNVLADVVVECPTWSAGPGSPINYTGGTFIDSNGDGMIRADDSEITAPVSDTQVCLHLAAGDGLVNMADGREQYMFGFANATGTPNSQVLNVFMEGAVFPAPTIKLKQGDDVYLTLTNVGMNRRPDLFDPHTVHWHGFPNASAVFDGVPDASISINMGSSLTYYYHVVDPGTFMYHCHVEAAEHMQMGMLGNLYVTTAQDGTSFEYPVSSGKFYTKFAYNDGDGSTGYDVDYPLQLAAFDPTFHDASFNIQTLPFANMDDKYPMFNGRGYPDTVKPLGDLPLHNHSTSSPVSTLMTPTAGDRMLIRISSLSTTSFHTIGIFGLKMQVVGQGSRQLKEPYMTNSITIGGGESVDVIIDTAGTTAGEKYFVYATNLDHLSNDGQDYGGMMTEIQIQ